MAYWSASDEVDDIAVIVGVNGTVTAPVTYRTPFGMDVERVHTLIKEVFC